MDFVGDTGALEPGAHAVMRAWLHHPPVLFEGTIEGGLDSERDRREAAFGMIGPLELFFDRSPDGVHWSSIDPLPHVSWSEDGAFSVRWAHRPGDQYRVALGRLGGNRNRPVPIEPFARDFLVRRRARQSR
ncbi:MAG: hypothetical protein AAF196_16790 [Planctomycetota bacterium]